MSLSLRLILLILGVVFSMLIAGAYIAINTARQTVAHETESSARHTLQLLSAAIIRAQTDNPATSQHILIRHLQELFLARHINICCTAARWQRHPAQLPHQGSRTRNGTWLVRQTDITTPGRIPSAAGYARYSTYRNSDCPQPGRRNTRGLE